MIHRTNDQKIIYSTIKEKKREMKMLCVPVHGNGRAHTARHYRPGHSTFIIAIDVVVCAHTEHRNYKLSAKIRLDAWDAWWLGR